MVYAMFSIGILGFLVWSFFFNLLFTFAPWVAQSPVVVDSAVRAVSGVIELIDCNYKVGLLYCEVEVINFAVCWDSLTLVGTFYSKNLTSYTQSAGNLNTKNFSLTSSSETTRETSFDFTLFQLKSKTTLSYD